jgi:hypothetical protein
MAREAAAVKRARAKGVGVMGIVVVQFEVEPLHSTQAR